MITLCDEVEIHATPAQVFAWIADLPAHYLEWHPDHLSCRWERGTGLAEGARLVCEERLHGEVHRLTLTATRVVPDRLLEYRMPYGDGSFETLPSDGGAVFVAGLRLGTRIPLIGRLVDAVLIRFFGDRLLAMRTHMAEEGVNLKALLEGTPPAPGRDVLRPAAP